jgi:hypothetical protein
MLYFPTHTLAAMENDRLRTAERYRLLAKVRREQTAPHNRRRRSRWPVFRVSSMTGSAS